MKLLILIFPFLITLLLISCGNKGLGRDEAAKLVKEKFGYPKVWHHDIYCGDPGQAKNVLDAGLEEKGFLTVLRKRSIMDGYKPLINLTSKADPYLLPTPEEAKKRNVQIVKLADEEFVAITAIKNLSDNKTAIVEYTTVFKNVTPFSALVKGRNFKDTMTHKAQFSLYDDGWHREKGMW